jgi:ribose-phosphate pyrophosphokinase
MDNIRLITGRSNEKLAHCIASYLGKPLVNCKIIDFANGEIYVEIEENVRGRDVYFIQTGSGFEGRSINDHYMEAIQVADACRRSDVKSICIIYALFPYARSDKKDKPRVSIMSSVIANGLEQAGYSRIITMEIHAPQSQGVTKLPFDNLYGKNIHISNLKKTIFKNLTEDEIKSKFVLVAPDL